MRSVIIRVSFAVVFVVCALPIWAAPTEETAARISEIETLLGGRIGIAALDTASGEQVLHRAGERFPMCSTFKVPLVAAVLHRVDEKKEQLDRFISYSARDILSYAPITKEHLSEGGMTIEALCDAAIRYSDNTAANLLLDSIGGPAGLTRYLRFLGDEVTRLDRKEEELNTAIPGDERDTTSPTAMMTTLRRLLTGDALTLASRDRLNEWMSLNTTGATLIRAGAPAEWRVGDKTGRGANGTINDVAVIRPPGRAPILLCIYTTGATAESDKRDGLVAEVTREVLHQLAR